MTVTSWYNSRVACSVSLEYCTIFQRTSSQSMTPRHSIIGSQRASATLVGTMPMVGIQFTTPIYCTGSHPALLQFKMYDAVLDAQLLISIRLPFCAPAEPDLAAFGDQHARLRLFAFHIFHNCTRYLYASHDLPPFSEAHGLPIGSSC